MNDPAAEPAKVQEQPEKPSDEPESASLARRTSAEKKRAASLPLVSFHYNADHPDSEYQMVLIGVRTLRVMAERVGFEPTVGY